MQIHTLGWRCSHSSWAAGDWRELVKLCVVNDFVLDPEQFVHGDEDPNGPRIAIVVALDTPDTNQFGYNLGMSLTKRAFAAVRESGGRPRLVDSSAATLPEVATVCDEADAVLFLGGGDVDVTLYGWQGELPRGYYGVDKRADEFLIALMHECASRDMPVLAFCRGSQVFNVAFGGTLIGDIEEWGIHRGQGDGLMIDEPVRIEPDSHIARILGKTEAVVRNGHHQAVDRVGDELRGVVFAHDGIVEGTQHKTATWMLGIQWHPEEQHANLDDQRRIFRALVAEGRRFAGKSGQQDII